MLTLLCGADRLATSAALLCAVCARAEAGKGGNILIVPEQYSHETERALCRAGGDTISRYAEADVVIIAACGERAGEVVEILREFPNGAEEHR